MLSVRHFIPSYKFNVVCFALYSYAYRKGGPLAVTDANLLLGRLIPDYFPKIFGKSEKEPLDIEASRSAFEVLARQINDGQENRLSLDEIVFGLVGISILKGFFDYLFWGQV